MTDDSAVAKDVAAFRKVVHEMQRHMLGSYGRIRDDHGLSPHQYGLLYHLWKTGPTHLSGLKRFIPGHLSGIGQLVERLVHAGWVDRRHPEEDRRKLVVSLTDKAVSALESIKPFGLARAFEHLDGASQPKRRQALEAIRIVAELVGVEFPALTEDNPDAQQETNFIYESIY
jgi:DNA-binding MarR family transcriptional regulator